MRCMKLLRFEGDRRVLLFGAIVLSLGLSTSFAQTKGIFLDKGGAVFNVKAYGATGDGTTPDTAAIQSAINAAVSAGGGVVYFPAGSYLLNGTLTNTKADTVSLVGTGTASQLKVSSTLGLDVSLNVSVIGTEGFHSGSIASLRFTCTSSSSIAVRMTDVIAAPSLRDLTVSNCNTAFDLVNNTYWTERLVAVHVTDDYNTHFFHYDQNPSSNSNSYGYGVYDGVYINKTTGQDVFYLTGGAYLYHSSFTVKGNFGSASTTSASVFNIEGAGGQPCPGAALNTYDIQVEGFASYSFARWNNNGCSGGATGNAIVAGGGTLNLSVASGGTIAGTATMIRDESQLAYLVGKLTTTAATADTLNSSEVYPTSQCYVAAANGSAANILSSAYVSAVNWSTVTVTHYAAAGAIFQVWCTHY